MDSQWVHKGSYPMFTVHRCESVYGIICDRSLIDVLVVRVANVVSFFQRLQQEFHRHRSGVRTPQSAQSPYAHI